MEMMIMFKPTPETAFHYPLQIEKSQNEEKTIGN